jgi:hypothetical protein
LLCPWVGRLPPHSLLRNFKLKKHSFAHTAASRPKQPPPKPDLLPFTPKSFKQRAVFEQTVCLSKKIVNLSEEFEEIYKKRKENFVRQHLRLKTVA